MPIVFVHGVNNRKEDKEYAGDIGCKTEFLRTLFAPPLGLDPTKVNISFPYWGDHGVKFLWNQVSLPGGGFETLGLEDSNHAIDFWLSDVHDTFGATAINLSKISRERSFEEAVDLIWDTAAVALPSKHENSERIAVAYQASQRYIKNNPAPTWAWKGELLSNKAFVDTLVREIEDLPADEKKLETFGLKDWLASTKERGGSVCLNSFGLFVKWISASIMPPPSSVPAR